MLELLAAITLQDNSKKEFAPWVTKEITWAIHFRGELQYLQDWCDYLKKKYNFWGDGSRISIGYTSKLIATGYTMHLTDTSSRRGHNLCLLPLHPQTHQPPPQSLLKPAPVIQSHDQVDVSRQILIYRYWDLGVRPDMYAAKVAV